MVEHYRDIGEKWTVILYADNGWNFMEGENIGHNPPSLAASASYHIGDFDFTLYMHNPFMAHPKSYSAECQRLTP